MYCKWNVIIDEYQFLFSFSCYTKIHVLIQYTKEKLLLKILILKVKIWIGSLDKKYWFSSNRNLSSKAHFYYTFVILGVQSVDIISMDIPQVAESGKSLVLDCRFEYRYTDIFSK